MLRRSCKRTTVTGPPSPDPSNSVPPADGSFHALEQMANWVRFADTKATILTAGFGAVLSILVASSGTIVDALVLGDAATYVTGLLVGLTVLLGCYTLFWLVRAIEPRCDVSRTGINRFAWPTLIGVQAQELLTHSATKPTNEDAWQQVLDLASLADRKFQACTRATRGFATLVIVGVACLATAAALSEWTRPQEVEVGQPVTAESLRCVAAPLVL